MDDVTGVAVTPRVVLTTRRQWERVAVVGAVAATLAALALLVATPTGRAGASAWWLTAVVTVSFALLTVQPLVETDRRRVVSIDAGSLATMVGLVVLAPANLLAAIVVGHLAGWVWHRRGEGVPVVSPTGRRKLVGNATGNLAQAAVALLVHTLVCAVTSAPAPVCAAVAVVAAEATSLAAMVVLIGDAPATAARRHGRAVLRSPAPWVVLVVGGLVTTQAASTTATAGWLAAATACLWLLGRHQVGVHDELEQHRALLEVARDLPTHSDRAAVERLLLARARAVTHAASASFEDRPPLAPSVGAPLDADGDRWLVVHDRTHEGEAFRPGEQETLRGLATLGRLALDNLALTEDLHHAATHDQLTGLVSRRGLEHHWAPAAARAARRGDSLGVVYVDLDRFKQVNDRRGHAAGDAVLRAVARRLDEVARDSDLVCRIGGDEFLVVAEGVGDAPALAALTDRVRGALGPRPGHGAAAIPASVGAARFPEDGATLDAVVRAADAAMYRDKGRMGAWYGGGTPPS